jgi:NitT/TauT family transport system permease protein
VKRILPSLIVILIALAIWQGLSFFEVIPSFLISSPRAIGETYLELKNDYVTAAQSTLLNSAMGFLASLLVAYSSALLLTRFRVLQQAFMPFAIFFQTIPVIAIAPLLVIWFGFGEPTVRACAMIVSFFPIFANSLTGLSSVDPGLLELFQAYGANRRKVLFSLQIPSSLQSLYSGLLVAAGLSVIGAIVGEFIAGGGLGGMIDSARTQQRVDIVLGAILLSSALGVGFVSLIRWTFRKLLKWRPFFHQQDLQNL